MESYTSNQSDESGGAPVAQGSPDAVYTSPEADHGGSYFGNHGDSANSDAQGSHGDSYTSNASTPEANDDGSELKPKRKPGKKGTANRLVSMFAGARQNRSLTTSAFGSLFSGSDKVSQQPSFKLNMTAGFIQGEIWEEDPIDATSSCLESRRSTKKLLEKTYIQVLLGLVSVVDFFLSCTDSDVRAAHQESLTWVKAGMNVTLSIYCIELSLNFFVRRWAAFESKWIILDCVIIAAGLLEVLLELAQVDLDGLSTARVLRLLRFARMVRVLRKFGKVKELRRLLDMAVGCTKTLLWSFVFLFIVMTVWAVACVEIVHPLVETLDDAGTWKDCDDCRQAFSTVMMANLTLFRTIVAGDGWGTLAVPVIREYPASGIIFIGACLTIVYGVLNLVVAVVVDTFAEERTKNETLLAMELEEEQGDDLLWLQRVFDKIDEDKSGDVSLDELMTGAKSTPEFRSRLRVMDIDEADLQQLFLMLDEDKSGTIDPNEFVSTLNRWKYESKTAARFIKYQLLKNMQEQEETKQMLMAQMEVLFFRMETLARIVSERQGSSKSSSKSKREKNMEATDILNESFLEGRGSIVKCSCGSTFMADSMFCRSCGKKRPQQPESSLSTKCECGNIFMTDASFCRMCGRQRGAAATPASSANEDGRSTSPASPGVHGCWHEAPVPLNEAPVPLNGVGSCCNTEFNGDDSRGISEFGSEALGELLRLARQLGRVAEHEYARMVTPPLRDDLSGAGASSAEETRIKV